MEQVGVGLSGRRAGQPPLPWSAVLLLPSSLSCNMDVKLGISCVGLLMPRWFLEKQIGMIIKLKPARLFLGLALCRRIRTSARSRLGSGLVGLYVHKTMRVLFLQNSREHWGNFVTEVVPVPQCLFITAFQWRTPEACPLGKDREQEGK